MKLHGSLDWIDDSEFGICSLECPRNHNATELDGATPLLIFGTDSKLTGKEPFLSLLYQFSRALDECDLFVTLGFSFSDPHVNDIVVQRFNTNTRMQIVVVGYGGDAHQLTARVRALHG